MEDRAIAEAAMKEAAWRLERAIESVHERVPCPKCGAPVGQRCRSMPRGYRPLDGPDRGRVLKSPHRQRIRADGISLR